MHHTKTNKHLQGCNLQVIWPIRRREPWSTGIITCHVAALQWSLSDDLPDLVGTVPTLGEDKGHAHAEARAKLHLKPSLFLAPPIQVEAIRSAYGLLSSLGRRAPE